jgi:hypothetical protein
MPLSAKAVGRRAHGFGMRVQHHGGRPDELARPVEFGEAVLAGRAPLTPVGSSVPTARAPRS